MIKRDRAFRGEPTRKQDVDAYKLIVVGMMRNLFDRDTAPGAEPEDMLQLDIPALVVPGQRRLARHVSGALSRRVPARDPNTGTCR